MKSARSEPFNRQTCASTPEMPTPADEVPKTGIQFNATPLRKDYQPQRLPISVTCRQRTRRYRSKAPGAGCMVIPRGISRLANAYIYLFPIRAVASFV